MARSFRDSRFRRRDDLAEDINPSAYIVNLADCMLVLACGFMVAMMVYWNIDLANVEELQAESLEEVAPEEMMEDLQSGGSYYVEAGIVYQDPNTGQLWMVRKEEDGAESSASGDTGTSGNTGGDETTTSDVDTDIGSVPANNPSRAEGAD